MQPFFSTRYLVHAQPQDVCDSAGRSTSEISASVSIPVSQDVPCTVEDEDATVMIVRREAFKRFTSTIMYLTRDTFLPIATGRPGGLVDSLECY